jgi:signal transduction histidine kinase/ligand-binding sensor domain-containing protein/DNA-binding response OmpR family regulator
MRRLLLTLIWTLLSLTNFGQSLYVYKTESLPSSLFKDVVRDSLGYVWIGTEYGLARFDGVRFRNFFANSKADGALINNQVRKLYTDSHRRVWVATNGGLQYWNEVTHKFTNVLDNSGNGIIANAMTDTPNGVFILRTNGELLIYDENQGVAVKDAHLNKMLSLDSGYSMLADSRGVIWIGTDGEGVVKYVSGQKYVKRYSDPPVESSDPISGFHEGSDGTVYAIMCMHVAKYDKREDRFITIPSDFDPVNFRTASSTPHGVCLIGTYGGGVAYIDESSQTLRHYFMPETPEFRSNTSNVTGVLMDNKENLIVCAFQNGIGIVSKQSQRFNTTPMSNYKFDNGKPISTVQFDSHSLWVGQDRNGLWQLDTAGNVLNHYADGFSPLCLYHCTDGKIYVGLYDSGLAVINPATGEWHRHPAFGYVRIRSIVETKGTLYVAVFNKGIRAFDVATGQEKVMPPVDANKAINAMYVDRRGQIWVGTYNGIYCYNPAKNNYVVLPENQALKSAVIYSILEGRDGNIWFATTLGLFGYNPQTHKISQLTTEDGLTNDIVCGLVEDSAGRLWCSTFKGLNCYNLKTGKILNYETGLGLSEVSYQRGTATKTDDNKIIFTNDRQIVDFHPEQVLLNNSEQLPTPILTGLSIYNNNVIQDYSGDKPIEQCYEFEFSSDQNTFKLDFSVFDINIANSHSLEYRLNDGDVWTPIPNNSWSLSLAALPYGTHTIEVRIDGNDITSESLKLKLKVLPPWYLTWWAKTFYLLIICLAVLYGVQSYRRHRLYAENEDRLRFFMDVAHEFRSPITLMLTPLQKLLKKNTDPAITRTIQHVYHNANRLQLLVNQILDIRKLDKGKMTNRFVETDIVYFINEITKVFEYEAQNDNITLQFKSDLPKLDVWVDRNHLEKIVYNLLSNAFKYTPDGGEITVEVASADGNALITVTDTGNGVSPEQIPLIFDRYYRVPGENAKRGTSSGIGLNLCRQLVEIHKGKISVSNRQEPEHGAIFTVTLPLGKEHLPEADRIVETSVTAAPSPILVSSVEAISTRQEKLKSGIKRTSYRVVVVDDDDELREYLRSELHPYYHVSTYPNGRVALTKIIEEVPDLVITDVRMPEMDGFELLHRLKNNNITSHIPVMVLSSETEAESRVTGFNKGADAYVDKPFSMEEMLSRIESMLANRRRIQGKLSGAQDQVDRTVNIQMKDANDQLMETIMKYLNENISSSNLNIENLAQEVGLSRSQLYRRVKEITGISCGEFVRNYRLNQAARLLKENPTIQVAQIAYETGFAHPTNFSTTFKKHFGVSPAEYAEQYKSTQS